MYVYGLKRETDRLGKFRLLWYLGVLEPCQASVVEYFYEYNG